MFVSGSSEADNDRPSNPPDAPREEVHKRVVDRGCGMVVCLYRGSTKVQHKTTATDIHAKILQPESTDSCGTVNDDSGNGTDGSTVQRCFKCPGSGNRWSDHGGERRW